MFLVSLKQYLIYLVQILVSFHSLLVFLWCIPQANQIKFGTNSWDFQFSSVADLPVTVGVRVLPQGYWHTVLYSSVILLLCLLVCLVGAHIYSRTAFAILLVITVSLLSIFISAVAVKPQNFVITHKGPGNQTVHYNASYTGFNATTLRNNLHCECQGQEVDGIYNVKSFLLSSSVVAHFSCCSWLLFGLQHQLHDVFCHRLRCHVHQLHWDHGRSQHVRLMLILLVSSHCCKVNSKVEIMK